MLLALHDFAGCAMDDGLSGNSKPLTGIGGYCSGKNRNAFERFLRPAQKVQLSAV